LFKHKNVLKVSFQKPLNFYNSNCTWMVVWSLSSIK